MLALWSVPKVIRGNCWIAEYGGKTFVSNVRKKFPNVKSLFLEGLTFQVYRHVNRKPRLLSLQFI